MLTGSAKQTCDSATQALWAVAETDDTNQVESILASGADINASNEHGVTALMRAAEHGRVRMVRVLLELGAEPNMSRNDKFTPLMLAAFFGHKEIVRILVEHGADISASSRFGTSAQMWALSRTFKDVVHYLKNPSNSPASSEVKVTDSRTDRRKQQRTVSLERESDLKLAPLPSPVESPVENASVVTEQGPAGIGPVENAPTEKGQDFAPNTATWLQRFNRSVAYALVLVAAVLTGWTLRQQLILRTDQNLSIKVTESAVGTIPVDTSSNAGVTRKVEVSNTAAEKVASSNNSNTTNEKESKLKRPLVIRGVGSKGGSSRSAASKQRGKATSADPVEPVTPITSEGLRSELPSTPPSVIKPQPAVPRNNISSKKPSPSTSQLLTRSKNLPSTSRVIQWP